MPDQPLAHLAQGPRPRLNGGRRRVLRCALAGIAGWSAGAAWAAALPAPKGPVVLSVVGRVSRPNVGERADFDMAMLEAMPVHSFSSDTPWFEGPHHFSGPLLREVLAAAGAQGEALRAVALNRYKVDIPFDDTQRFNMILATRLDGKPMPVREKGPLFIVYPFPDSASLRSERYYGRSAWQLRSIEVR